LTGPGSSGWKRNRSGEEEKERISVETHEQFILTPNKDQTKTAGGDLADKKGSQQEKERIEEGAIRFQNNRKKGGKLLMSGNAS